MAIRSVPGLAVTELLAVAVNLGPGTLRRGHCWRSDLDKRPPRVARGGGLELLSGLCRSVPAGSELAATVRFLVSADPASEVLVANSLGHVCDHVVITKNRVVEVRFQYLVYLLRPTALGTSGGLTM